MKDSNIIEDILYWKSKSLIKIKIILNNFSFKS